MNPHDVRQSGADIVPVHGPSRPSAARYGACWRRVGPGAGAEFGALSGEGSQNVLTDLGGVSSPGGSLAMGGKPLITDATRSAGMTAAR